MILWIFFLHQAWRMSWGVEYKTDQAYRNDK
jgi:hypothetical protein